MNLLSNFLLKRSFRDSFIFRSVLVHKVYDLRMGTNLNKATKEVPRKIIKLASSHLFESLTYILNQSLQQGVVPNILKISKVKPIDKGGEVTDPTNFRPISTLQATFTQIFEKFTYICCFSTISRNKKLFFNFNLALEKDIQLPKL